MYEIRFDTSRRSFASSLTKNSVDVVRDRVVVDVIVVESFDSASFET